MDRFPLYAYWVALFSVIAYPPLFVLWFIIHPFTRLWRRLGPVATYLVVGGMLSGMAIVLYTLRDPLLSVSYGARWPLVALGVPLLVAGLVIKQYRRKHLTPSMRFGLPQLSGASKQGTLLTEGIYARVRNPTYLEGGVALAGVALLCNYLAVYVLLALYLPVIYAVVLLEEHELRERFGAEYDDYCRRVPRFLPRLGRRPT